LQTLFQKTSNQADAMKGTVSQSVVAEFEEYAPQTSAARNPDSTVHFRLLKPNSETPGERYPLVLYLHGAGERGGDNIAHLKYLPAWMATEWRARFPCYLLAPQRPAGAWWIEVDWSGPRGRMARDIGGRLRAIVAAMDELIAEFPIDRRRQYVTGISMGGFATWDVAIRFPGLFAAMVPICGGGDPEQVGVLARMPVWCFHGERDDIVPAAHSAK
jgi:predicted peptidase